MRTWKQPAEWDAELDLLILLGREAASAAEDARAGGQKRIVVVAPEPESDLPEDVLQVESPERLVLPLLAMTGETPKRVSVMRTIDPWATRERQAALVRTASDALHSKQVQRETLRRHGATRLVQGLANLPELVRWPAIGVLDGRFQGRPAVVCAPGPSLSAALPVLRANAGRAVVIAISHALHALLAAGVEPDLVLVADPGNVARHFEGLDLERVGAVLIAATCRPEVFAVEAPRKVHFAGNGQLDAWLYEPTGENAAVPTGGSVSCSAASVAVRLGCDRVAFVGMDLAFPGDRYYAEESLDGSAEVVRTESGRFFLRKPADSDGPGYALADGGRRFTADHVVYNVPAADGGLVPTSLAMKIFQTWFEGQAATLSGRVRFTQTSKHGAYLAGCEHRSLAEWFASTTAEPLDVRSVLNAALAHDARESRRRRYLDHFRATERTLQLLIELATSLERIAGRIALSDVQRPAFDEGMESLCASLRPLGLLVLAAYDDMLSAAEERRLAADRAAYARASRRLCAVVRRAAQLCLEPLAGALAELEATEFKPEPAAA